MSELENGARTIWGLKMDKVDAVQDALNKISVLVFDEGLSIEESLEYVSDLDRRDLLDLICRKIDKNDWSNRLRVFTGLVTD